MPKFASAWPGRVGEGIEGRSLELRGEEAALTARLEELGEELVKTDGLPLATVRAATLKIEARLAEIERELDATYEQWTAQELVNDFEAVGDAFLEELTLSQQRKLISTVFESITVRGRGSGSRAPFSRDLVTLTLRA